MYYGDDVVVTKEGLKIKEKSLLPIGISDQSICWGIETLYIPDPEECEKRNPHLIISPFPPQRWHALYQILIQLKKKPSMMLKATEAFVDLGINILSNQCATVGHKKALWHVIVEDIDLKSKLDEILPEIVKRFDKNYSQSQKGGDHTWEEFVDDLSEEFCLLALRNSMHIKDVINAKGQNNFLVPAYRTGRSILFRKSLLEELTANKAEEDYYIEFLNNKINHVNRCIEAKLDTMNDDCYDLLRVFARQIQLDKVINYVLKNPYVATQERRFKNHKQDDGNDSKNCNGMDCNCETIKSDYPAMIERGLAIRKKRLLSLISKQFSKFEKNITNADISHDDLHKNERKLKKVKKQLANILETGERTKLIKQNFVKIDELIEKLKKEKSFLELEPITTEIFNMLNILIDLTKYYFLERRIARRVSKQVKRLKTIRDDYDKTIDGLVEKLRKHRTSDKDENNNKHKTTLKQKQIEYRKSVKAIQKKLKKKTHQKRIETNLLVEGIKLNLEAEYKRQRKIKLNCTDDTSYNAISDLFTEMINLGEYRDKISKQVPTRYKDQLNHSVKSYWLRRLAMYRIYSELQKNHPIYKSEIKAPYDDPIKFKYHSNSGMLIPDDDLSKDKYKEIVRSCFKGNLPAKIIAAFDPNEHYVRINFPGHQDRIFVKVEYDFNLDSTEDSSKGLLNDLLIVLAKRKVNVSYISNTIVNYEEGKQEKGSIYLIGYFDDSEIKTEQEIDYAMSDVEAELGGLGTSNVGKFDET